MSGRAHLARQKKWAAGPPSEVLVDFLYYMVEAGERYPIATYDLTKAFWLWQIDWYESNRVAVAKQHLPSDWVLERWMESLGYETTAPSAKNGWRREHERGEMTRWKGISWR